MAARHNFEQQDVLRARINGIRQNLIWHKFIETSIELGLTVRTTGGAVLTHEINCSKEDFDVVLDLVNCS